MKAKVSSVFIWVLSLVLNTEPETELIHYGSLNGFTTISFCSIAAKTKSYRFYEKSHHLCSHTPQHQLSSSPCSHVFPVSPFLIRLRHPQLPVSSCLSPFLHFLASSHTQWSQQPSREKLTPGRFPKGQHCTPLRYFWVGLWGVMDSLAQTHFWKNFITSQVELCCLKNNPSSQGMALRGQKFESKKLWMTETLFIII